MIEGLVRGEGATDTNTQNKTWEKLSVVPGICHPNSRDVEAGGFLCV